jgi:predicted acetyltransferase
MRSNRVSTSRNFPSLFFGWRSGPPRRFLVSSRLHSAGRAAEPSDNRARRPDMADSQGITLDEATLSDAPLLSNLLELYIHDLSEVFPNIELGEDGRFGYDRLPLYWSEGERRFAFLIRLDGRVVGFVLATRGSPVAEDPDALDIAEFFVIRRHRRSGVGRRAAFLLWNGLPGKWTVRVSEGNPIALRFWSGVIAEFTGGTTTESKCPGQPHGWRVFSLETMPGHVAS